MLPTVPVESSTSSVRLKTLLSKSKVWKYFGFHVDENDAVTNKKQVVRRICERSLHTRETQQTCSVQQFFLINVLKILTLLYLSLTGKT